jgi:hypothetical protein
MQDSGITAGNSIYFSIHFQALRVSPESKKPAFGAGFDCISTTQ